MEVKIVEQKKQKLVIELVGEDHSLPNALRSELNSIEGVKTASYNIAHPMISSPVLMIETDSKTDAKEALLAAISSLESKNKALLKKVSAK